jgi:hypothetical protein
LEKIEPAATASSPPHSRWSNTVNIDTPSNPSHAGQASSTHWPINSFKDRDAWIRLMLSVHVDALSCAAKIVAARLALHHNIEREQCNPSIRELVLGTGMSESTVRRAVRELEQKGWLSVTRTSGGHRFSSSNSFELRAPPLSVMAGATPVTRDTHKRESKSERQKRRERLSPARSR